MAVDALDLEQLQESLRQEAAKRRDSLLRAIDTAAESAYGSDTDEVLASERSLSIRFFLGENVEPGPEGRSQVTDRSVFETIQWILPSLLRIFAGGGNVVEFEPLGPDDEEGAAQESDYLNYIVTQKNRWFDILLAWFQNALLTRNGYCMAYMDDYTRTETETYENQTAMQVTYLLQVDGVQVLQFSAKPDPQGQPQIVLDPMTGQPVQQPAMLYDIKIRRTRAQNKVCFHVLPPERCKVSDRTPNHTLEDCDYFEYWENKTLSEVRQMGFQVDDDVASDSEYDTQEDLARDRQFTNRQIGGQETDPSLRQVKLRTIWIKHDTDGDGIAELQRVIRLGHEILYLEEESRIPVSSIVPYILTHRHIGMSLTDIVLDLQRIMTAILRQGLDNLYQSNNVRWAHTDKVNLDDLLTSQPGGAVAVDGVPAENLMPMTPPFLFPQAIAGLEYMDAVKEKRTGINKTFTGVDADAIHKTATGVNQLSTMAAQRVEQIARVFAPGIEYLFSVAHELLLKHGAKKDVVKLRGRWVEVDPSTWKTGRDMKISVGFGAGNKDMVVARLMNIWQMQTSPFSANARIVDPKNLYETAMALTKASDFTTPHKFWTDPTQLPPPPPPPPTTDQVFAQVEGAKIQSNERIKAAELSEQGRQADNRIRADLAKQQLKDQGDIIKEHVKAHIDMQMSPNEGMPQ